MHVTQLDRLLAQMPRRKGLVARALHWLLALEAGLMLGLAWYLFARWHGALPELSPALMILLAGLAGLVGLAGLLLVRFAITLHNFQLAARVASPCPEKLGKAQWLRLLLAEFYSTLYSSSWAMLRCAFERHWFGASTTPPVLMVHGYVCNSGYWHRLSRVLQRERINHFALDLEPVFGSIDDYVPMLRQAVESICRESGSEQVIIVAHSMGGLAARAYMRDYGSVRVARLITIGSPHHGTGIATRGPGVNSRQMEWLAKDGSKSEWLQALDKAETPESRKLMTSIFSYQDNIISPQLSSVLDGAKNVPFVGIGHVELALHPKIHACVLDEIRSVAVAA